MKNITAKVIGVTSALCAALAIIPSAQAQVTFTLGSGPQSFGTTLEFKANGVDEQSASGPYLATINGVANIPVFCVDLTHSINWSQSYQADISQNVTNSAGAVVNGYYQGGLASAIGNGTSSNYGAQFAAGSTTAQQNIDAQQRADEVAWIADNYMMATSFSNSIDNSVNDNFAALTAAIWDITQNGGNGGYTAGSSFYLETPGYSSLINYYEGLAKQHSTYTSSDVKWIQAPIAGDGSHLQNFMYISPVPEPGVIVTSVSLMSMVGLAMFRGRRRKAVSSNTAA
jgi:hypothetical protein